MVGPSSLRAVITDLEPSTKYEVHIWAVNDAGVEGLKKRLDVYTQMATGQRTVFLVIRENIIRRSLLCDVKLFRLLIQFI